MKKRLLVAALALILGFAAPTIYAATLTVQKPTLSGATITFAAASAGGDVFTNTGSEVLRVKTTGTPVTVTITAQKPCNQGVLHNVSVTVPATSEREIGPFRDLVRWNNNSKQVAVTYDQVTGVTIAAVGR